VGYPPQKRFEIKITFDGRQTQNIKRGTSVLLADDIKKLKVKYLSDYWSYYSKYSNIQSIKHKIRGNPVEVWLCSARLVSKINLTLF
jgi:hypothetical protein